MTLWGGRFNQSPGEAMRRLNDSYPIDRRLYAHDIRGSIAYAGALHRAGLIDEAEHADIVRGLEQVRAEFESGTFERQPTDEDIHTAVERRLTEIIGAAAGKLHTGRSRNDQVALDVRLWLLDAITGIDGSVSRLQAAIIEKASAHTDLIMPGYTHLQPAQPVLFAHWLMSFFWMLDRDRNRLTDSSRRTAISPLGAGALAGSPLPIDRAALAESLGLVAITENSMDAVSDRDFIAEFLFDAALVGVHLSRLAEDLILFSGPGYRFVTLGEGFTTGSSLMPQKRNPDALELTRGKAGPLAGNLLALLTTLKGLPSTYDKDLQEDKALLFSSVDTLEALLPVVTGVVETLTPNGDAMRAALSVDMLATDLADYLVDRGVPFREAHHLVGQLVKLAESRGVALDALTAEDFAAVSPHFGADVAEVFSFERSVARRESVGGTAQNRVQEQIDAARARLAGRDSP